MKILTLKTLKEKGACESALTKFNSLFGESVEVTVDLCIKHVGDFDWGWARCLLSATARAEYKKSRATAQAEYDKLRAPEWAIGYLNE